MAKKPKDESLIQVNPVGFFLIGQRVGAFEAQWMKDSSVANVAPFWRDLMGGLDHFLKQPVVPEGLARSTKAARELATYCGNLWTRFHTLLLKKQADAHKPFPAEVVFTMTMHLDTFRTHLAGDVEELELFLVPQRLGYSTRTLLKEPGKLFGGFESDVMALAAKDVTEAARCFAFGLHTGAAFHMLRACELVLVDYCDACGVKATETTWARYIAALGTVKTLPPRIRGRLDRLREYDRNEIMHPGRFLSADDADTLFDYVKGSISDMMRDITARRAEDETVP